MRIQAIGFALLSCALAGGCGSGGGNGGDMSGGGGDDMNGGAGDMAMGGGGDGGAPADMSFNLAGKQLVKGNLTLSGVTSDGWAVYYDNDADAISAVSVAGGAPQKIVDAPCQSQFGPFLGVTGKVVFAWTKCDGNTGVGTLTVWTSAGGVKVAAMKAQGDLSLADVSDDGSLIAYTDNADGMQGDIIVDKPDHSAPKTVAKAIAIDTSSTDCAPIMGFSGLRLALASCLAAAANPDGGIPDGGLPPTLTVVSYDASGVPAPIATGVADYLRVDKKNGKLLVKDANNVGSIYAATGGMATATGIPDVSDGQFLSDGSAFVYMTNAGALDRAPAMGGMAVQLQKTVDGVMGFSPDGKYILFHSMTDQMSGLNDVLLAPTAAPAMPVALSAMANAAGGGLFGSTFTDDSKYALWFGNVDMSNFVGTPSAAPVAGGMTQTFGGSMGWSVLAAGASKVVVLDDYQPDMNGAGFGDLEVLDLAAGGKPKLLSNSVDLNVNVTADKKNVVYTFSAAMAFAGLYVAPLP